MGLKAQYQMNDTLDLIWTLDVDMLNYFWAYGPNKRKMLVLNNKDLGLVDVISQ